MRPTGILLDTHIWLWYLVGDSRLSKQLAALITDPNVNLWLTPFSVWEAILLGERKRVKMDEAPPNWVKKRLDTLEVREPPFTAHTAMLSRTLNFTHDDPVDRFIAATAHEQKLPLATADSNLTKLSWLETIS